MKHYDLIVIGSGPAGQKAAIQGSKLGKRVCIIEKNAVLGGAGINTGTIPSKALREAVLYLTGTSTTAARSSARTSGPSATSRSKTSRTFRSRLFTMSSPSFVNSVTGMGWI